MPGGAALLSSQGSPARAWALIDDGLVSRFGGALAWADRSGATSLDVLVDGGGEPSGLAGAAGIVARRAAAFRPAPQVWSVQGRSLSPAVASPAADPADDTWSGPEWALDLLASHGVEVVVEHGVLRGEVLGLEVARVVGDRLEVGVGRHDRAARVEMRPEEDLGAALDEAVAAVRSLRVPGAPSHPANTLARSRWLRSVVCSSPQSFGFASLRPVAPPLPWFDLPEAGAAPCVGTSSAGEPVVVVCSVGVDLDLVPTAADCRLLHASPLAELWLVVPEGDDVPVTRSLAGRLDPPALIRVVPRRWETRPAG